MQAYNAADPDPLHQFIAVGRAFITWGVSHVQEYAFCFLRVQQELLIQGKAPSYGEEQAQSSDLIMFNLVQELRKEYPVRQIPDFALLSMMVGMISRAIVDLPAFGGINEETKVQYILETCFGILFSETVPTHT